MTAENDQSSRVHLDYGHEPSRWTRFISYIHENFQHWWESVGYCIGLATYSAGGPKQLMLAFGAAFISGGFGLAIEHIGEDSGSSSGHFWMWIGGFLIGLVIPIPKTEPRKQ
jgi:hypothetical protein